VLYLRGETSEYPFYNYVCPACKGTVLNLKTGRCAECNFPAKNIAYCSTCKNLFSEFKPDLICPNDGNKLVVGHRPASQGIRFANSILDLIIIALLSSFVKSWLFYEMSWLIIFLYYFIFESVFQRTPAKLLTRTKVVNSDGQKPTVGTIAERTLIRFVPLEAFSFLGDRVYGWHDKWSRTYVVKTKKN
jgi:DNA-directed RNA polymerase subunit RPC12/RpoP